VLIVACLLGLTSACGSDGNGGSVVQSTDNTQDNPAIDIPTPNVLLIISDDQGRDASAQYSISTDLPDTPVLNTLATNGLVFDNAWATPACTTTRGTLISGQHGINSGVDRVPDLLPAETLTLQWLLERSSTNRYSTSVIGKWHLTGGNTSQIDHPADSGVGYYAGNIAGTISDYYNWSLTRNGVTRTSTQYHTSQITDLAIEWISQQSGPWFSWVAYVSPHSPFHLPPAELHQRNLSGTVDDIEARERDYYLASIEAMDSEIGRLLDSMTDEVRENTMVIFVGDNGTPRAVIDTASFDRSHGKSSLYEGGVNIPLVISGAGVNRSNEREAALVNTVDFYPTIAEIAGINAPDTLDGLSFKSLLEVARPGLRDFNYTEFVSDNITGWAVRDERYKLIEFSNGSRELYDLAADPREDNNLIGDENLATNVQGLSGFAASVRAAQ